MSSLNLMTKTLAKQTPAMYSTDGKAYESKVTAHYFNAVFDWYLLEYDPDSRDCFGWVINNSMPDCAELGYFNLNEFDSINDSIKHMDILSALKHGGFIERDLYFTQDRLSAVIDSHMSAHGFNF